MQCPLKDPEYGSCLFIRLCHWGFGSLALQTSHRSMMILGIISRDKRPRTQTLGIILLAAAVGGLVAQLPSEDLAACDRPLGGAPKGLGARPNDTPLGDMAPGTAAATPEAAFHSLFFSEPGASVIKPPALGGLRRHRSLLRC